MFVTRVLLKDLLKGQTEVWGKSVVTGHQRIFVRDKTADKGEFICYDPYIRRMSVYKETKKVSTFRRK